MQTSHRGSLILTLCAAVIVLAACANGNVRIKDMTASEVSRLVVDNQTTLHALIERLGEPGAAVTDADGVQTFEFYWVKSSPSPLVVIPFNFVPEYPTTKKSLRVWVNKEGVVTRHELSGVYYIYRRPWIGTDSAHSFRVLTPEELDDLVDPTDTAQTEQKSSPDADGLDKVNPAKENPENLAAEPENSVAFEVQDSAGEAEAKPTPQSDGKPQGQPLQFAHAANGVDPGVSSPAGDASGNVFPGAAPHAETAPTLRIQ